MSAGHTAQRRTMIESSPLGGLEFCRALSDTTDQWLATIFAEATEGMRQKDLDGLALVATGGYGTGQLAPFSDLDVLLLHEPRRQVDELAPRLWYPLWDGGVKLGHGVFTVKEALRLASSELDVATSQLSTRLIAGDPATAEQLTRGALDSWRKNSDRWLAELAARRDRPVLPAHAQLPDGDVAFALEPDLKEGPGGLRDVQALGWGRLAGLELDGPDQDALAAVQLVLLRVRVALHRAAGRPGDVLRLEDQDAVAAGAAYDSATEMMQAISRCGRSVGWIAGETWSGVRRSNGRLRRVADRPIAPGVELRSGEIQLSATAEPASDPVLVCRVATAAARHGAPIGRETLDRLVAHLPRFTETWPVGALGEFVALLLEGHSAIAPIEALDQRGLLVRLLPEWGLVRNLPQRNAYHRFTVDRHLLEAVANAADLAERVSRPDLLVLGALFHDLGKGQPGDHTDAGVLLAGSICPRLGLGPVDSAIVVDLVRHHLLLPDVATRRDLADDTTISAVAEAVRSPLVLELLHALTEADSLATGPSAWGSWKAELVGRLVERVGHVLGGGDVSEVTWRLFPGAHVLTLMARGGIHVLVDGDRLVTVAPDRPGLFSGVAGVLSLHGLGVLAAEAYSDEHGMAANELRVYRPPNAVEWTVVIADLERALVGRLAIEARLAERRRVYRRRRRTAAVVAPATVRLDNDGSADATVIEVRAPDSIGVLYRITKALSELALDIRHAKVQTLGDEVVDTFYVRCDGNKVEDATYLAEIERALFHAVG